MVALSRRAFTGSLAATAIAPFLPSSAAAAPAYRPRLGSDIGHLRRVLVHSIAPDDAPADRLDRDLLPFVGTDLIVAADQHRRLLAAIAAEGAELVEVAPALDAAIAATRRGGLFELWLQTAFPALAPHAESVTARSILGRDPRFRNRLGPDGAYRHLTDSTGSTIFTRDSAVMTPRGLLVCRAHSVRRRRENMLLRFLYRHSPQLKDYPIAFDAVEEGISVEGGDVMVIDGNTLFLGVGSRSDPRIAPVLAQRLDMDVLAVHKVKADYLGMPVPGTPMKLAQLKVLLLHLDTFFTLVGPRHALSVPYLLEKEHAEDNPLSRWIRGARADTMMDGGDAEEALGLLKDFGKVSLYRRGTGKKEDLGDVKLVDHLRSQGYRFTWAGGPRPASDQDAFDHFMAVTYPELHRQACNVVQVRPGSVIAYDGNPATKAALRADGISVTATPARELWAWSGGPHCLTQPLERS